MNADDPVSEALRRIEADILAAVDRTRAPWTGPPTAWPGKAHVLSQREYTAQARAAGEVEQLRVSAMAPFATHVVGDEMVFAGPTEYEAACAAADAAVAEWRARTAAPTPTLGGNPARSEK